MKQHFLCIDKADSFIFGNFDSDTARNIELTLKRCTGGDTCASEKEVINYFQGKYIGVLSNQIRFDSSRWEADSIIKESVLTWIPVSTQVQLEVPFEVVRAVVNLQDKLVNLEEFTELSDDGIFRFKKGQNKPFEYN